MTFYKSFDKDLCYRGLQFAIGTTTTTEGEIHMNGLHCRKQALGCLARDPYQSRFCEVLPSGETIAYEVVTDTEKLTVIREIVGGELSDLLSGLYEEWHENGRLKLSSTYKDGKLEGLEKYWHDNGQLWCVSTYKDGKQDGVSRSWYRNTKPQGEYFSKNGKLDGPYKGWHENGQLQEACTYKDGELDGARKLWYENGQLEYEGTDENSKHWDETGRLWLEI